MTGYHQSFAVVSAYDVKAEKRVMLPPEQKNRETTEYNSSEEDESEIQQMTDLSELFGGKGGEHGFTQELY